jgi:Bax protein
MKIKVIKKRKKESKTQNSNQLELSFIDSSKKKNKNIIQAQTINSISRIFLSSLVLVSFFYVLPILINFTDNNLNTKEYTNNSKKILA